MAIERKQIHYNHNGGLEKEIYVQYKKKRLPRKEKKSAKKHHGDEWRMALNKGWFYKMLDYAMSQFCKEINKQ